MATSLNICIFALYATALVADISACSGKGEPACEADHFVGVDAKLVDVGIEEVGVQLVQKKTKSKRFQSKSQEVIGQTTGATPGWYMSGVDQSCTAGCAAQGLQCFESQQLANNGDVDSSAEVKALITQLGGVATTTAAPSGTQPSLGTQPPTQPPTQPSCAPRAQQVLTDADTDKDGKCSIAEALVAAAAMQGASSPEAMRPMIEPLDTDSDGYITCEELTVAMAGPPPGAPRLIQAWAKITGDEETRTSNILAEGNRKGSNL